MAYFNYRNLDPTDFEALAKDVMERVLGCKLYRYGDGSDGGIDLSDDSKKHKIVVQCKRYHQGAFSNLLGVLKREEKPKLERMDPRPEKYYLFTSIDLLPEQKVKILNLFNEFMKDDESFIVDGIAINEFFKDKKNHDLIERNRKLFDSYPENYDGLTDVNDEATREINIEQVFKTYINDFEEQNLSFASDFSKYDISGFITNVIESINSKKIKTLSEKIINAGVLASIIRSGYLYVKYGNSSEISGNLPDERDYSFYAEDISIPIDLFLCLVRTKNLLELSNQSDKFFFKRGITKEEEKSIAFSVLCIFFTDLFWIISKYPEEHADMIRYKTNADICQNLCYFTRHVSFQSTPVKLDSSKRRIDICLTCNDANSHKAAALFVNEFERLISGFENMFACLDVQFYYIRASILSAGQDHITNHNFEAYTPTLMPLLSGGHLYSSHLTFIRELTQNSIDSMSVRKRLINDSFDAKITVSLSIDPYSGSVSALSFSDNGMGMGKIDIERYLTSIGRSYYTTGDFKKLNLEYHPISYFGIGFLSCFLVCSSIDISTRCFDDGKAYHLSIPNIEGCFFIEDIQDDIPFGTKIYMQMINNPHISIFDILEYAWTHFLDLKNEVTFSWSGYEMMMLALKDDKGNHPKISHLDITQYVRKELQKPSCPYSFVNDSVLLPKDKADDFTHNWWNRHVRNQYDGIELTEFEVVRDSYSISPHSVRCPGEKFFLFLSFAADGDVVFRSVADIRETFEYDYGIFITDLPLAGMKNRSKNNGTKPYSGRLRILNSGILIDDASLESVFGENMRIYSNDQETAYNDVVINFPPGWIELNVAREKIICLSQTNVDKNKLLTNIARSTVEALNNFLNNRCDIPIVNIQEIASFITVICNDINYYSDSAGKKLLTELKKKKFLLKMSVKSDGVHYEMHEDNGDDMDMKSWFETNDSQIECNRQLCNATIPDSFFHEYELQLARKRVVNIEDINAGLARNYNLPEEYCNGLNHELALIVFSAYLTYFPKSRMPKYSAKAAHSRLALERQLMKKYSLVDFSSGNMKWVITNEEIATFIENFQRGR